MTIAATYQNELTEALLGLFNHWRVWLGDDELRAIHLGFSSVNTEIAVSLLTDNEPYLDCPADQMFGQPNWSCADWRLFKVNASFRHGFPDAAQLLDYMAQQAEDLSDAALLEFDAQLQQMMFAVLTADQLVPYLRKFRRLATPLRIGVQYWDENSILETELRF